MNTNEFRHPKERLQNLSSRHKVSNSFCCFSAERMLERGQGLSCPSLWDFTCSGWGSALVSTARDHRDFPWCPDLFVVTNIFKLEYTPPPPPPPLNTCNRANVGDPGHSFHRRQKIRLNFCLLLLYLLLPPSHLILCLLRVYSLTISISTSVFSSVPESSLQF